MIIKHKPVKLGNISNFDIKKAAKLYNENIPKMERKMKPLVQKLKKMICDNISEIEKKNKTHDKNIQACIRGISMTYSANLCINFLALAYVSCRKDDNVMKQFLEEIMGQVKHYVTGKEGDFNFDNKLDKNTMDYIQ